MRRELYSTEYICHICIFILQTYGTVASKKWQLGVGSRVMLVYALELFPAIQLWSYTADPQVIFFFGVPSIRKTVPCEKNLRPVSCGTQLWFFWFNWMFLHYFSHSDLDSCELRVIRPDLFGWFSQYLWVLDLDILRGLTGSFIQDCSGPRPSVLFAGYAAAVHSLQKQLLFNYF